jgi:predicted ArsR family transcriptional regulator
VTTNGEISLKDEKADGPSDRLSDRLSNRQREEYFHRSYTAVDGLWFMKAEEKYGFEAALELDEAVWKVLPKIQARMIKAMMGLENGIDGLEEAIAARLALEGFLFETTKAGDGFVVAISRCPWHDLMVKSGRDHLSEKVSETICRVENSAWASEFGGAQFEREERICQGAERCRMRFSL